MDIAFISAVITLILLIITIIDIFAESIFFDRISDLPVTLVLISNVSYVIISILRLAIK